MPATAPRSVADDEIARPVTLLDSRNLTLRQIVEHQRTARRSSVVGSPLTVANEIEH